MQLFNQVNKSSLAELKHWSKKTFEGSKRKLEKLMNRMKEIQQKGQWHRGKELISIER